MPPAFWQINVGHIIILIGMVGGFIVWFSRFEGRIRSTQEAVENLSKETSSTFEEQRRALSELAERISQIDKEGTRKSQQAITSDEKLAQLTLKRVDALEAMAFDQAPKVSAMARDIDWMATIMKTNIASPKV